MAGKINILLVLILTSLLSCEERPPANYVIPRIFAAAKRTRIDTPQCFLKNYGTKADDSLFVFVGEKISVTKLPRRQYSMDNSFKAKYRILKRVEGNFNGDTIEFAVFDHYGTPRFSRFTYALLYVRPKSGIYYHEKYLFNDVYKTKSGRWAGAYSIEDYEHDYNKGTKIKPVKIDFVEEVSYDTLEEIDGEKVRRWYPAPYFKSSGNKAIVVYGNYIEELLELKKNGVLKARSEPE